MAAVENVNVGLEEHVPELVLRSDGGDGYTTNENDSDVSSQEESDKTLGETKENSKEENSDEESMMNPGWADAMAKILKTNKPKGKKSIVLAKAKKLSVVLKTPKPPELGFEIDGEVKEEKTDSCPPPKVPEDKKLSKIMRKEWHSKGRVKPSILDKNREKILAKVATKGVVQLFNTVKDHQREITAKLKEAHSERKKEKVLKSIDKRAFLDVLMGSTGTNKKCKLEIDSVVGDKSEIKKDDDPTPTWNVLRDDFMLGASLKDWDKDQKIPNEREEKSKRKHTSLQKSTSNCANGTNVSHRDNEEGDDDDEDDDDDDDENSDD